MTADSVSWASRDLARAMKWRADLEAAAKVTGLDPFLLLGIASRETWIGCPAICDKRYPGLYVGDGGHGCGLLQVDDGARNGKHGPNFDLCESYKAGRVAEADMLLVGVKILRAKFDKLKAVKPSLSGEALTRAAVAAYNTGEGNVARSLSLGRDPDATTALGNYGADVIARAAFFRNHFGVSNG